MYIYSNRWVFYTQVVQLDRFNSHIFIINQNWIKRDWLLYILLSSSMRNQVARLVSSDICHTPKKQLHPTNNFRTVIARPNPFFPTNIQLSFCHIVAKSFLLSTNEQLFFRLNATKSFFIFRSLNNFFPSQRDQILFFKINQHTRFSY